MEMFKRLKAGFNALKILFGFLLTWNFEHMVSTSLILFLQSFIEFEQKLKPWGENEQAPPFCQSP